MSTEDNKRLVLEFLGHYSAARYDAALDLLAEDCTWWLPGHPEEFPAAGSVDKATVQRRLAGNLKLLPHGLEITTGAITAEQDRVALEAESRGTLVNGTEFDSSYKRGKPASFPLNRVVPCWTEGMQKIKVGGKATLTCPPATAYGEQGAGGVVPPNATLTFEVELLAIEK